MNRQEDHYNKLVARIGDGYYFCDYIFHDDRFKGATGSIMRPVSEAEAEDRRENYDEDGEMWKNAVADDRTTLGKDDWWELVLNTDGDEAVYDLSYADTYGEALMELLHNRGEDVELVECVGGGRCFHEDTEYDEVFDQELLDKINEVESK